MPSAAHTTKYRAAEAAFRGAAATWRFRGTGKTWPTRIKASGVAVRSAWVVLLFAATASGCDDTSGPPPVGSLTLMSAADSAEVASEVSLRVEALDAAGLPMEGAELRFLPEDGAGSTTPASAQTGLDGTASFEWTLGSRSGLQTLRVEANGASLSIALQATPAAPQSLHVVSDNELTGGVGDPLPEPILLEARDAFGNAVPGASLDANVSPADGSVSGQAVPSDASGQWALQWTLGAALGPQVLTATLSAAATLDLTVTGVPGSGVTLERVDGDGQQGRVDTELPIPLRVLARDRFGNPTPSALVTFTSPVGGGAASAGVASVQADSTGVAAAAWRLGTRAGTQTVEASLPSGATVSFTHTATPGSADRILLVSGADQSGPATRALAAPVVVEVRDAYDNAVPGTAIAFGVSVGGGSMTPPSASTGSDGRSSAHWILGPDLGQHGATVTIVGFTGSGPGTTEVTATATSLPPAQILVNAGDGQSAEVGTAVTSAPSARVFDAVGNPVPGVAVAFSVSSGGGSLSLPSPITDASGTATVGSWTLGPTAGTQSLQARVDSVAPVSFTATALAGPPSTLVKAAGDNQGALVGTTVSTPPRVRVTDTFGNGISGVSVSFQVTGGGGSVAGDAQVTDADGEAAVGSWTLGSSPGSNTLEASATGIPSVTFTATGSQPSPGFTLEVQFSGSPSASQQSTIASAAARWQQVITGDLPDFNASLSAGACGVNHSAYNGLVDDVVVFVEVVAIDGPGGVLGSAGPCWVRSGSMHPVFGSVRLDAADVANLESNGTLYDVAVHEFGHVLGIGTLWGAKGLLQGAGGSDPWFSGSRAIQEYQAMGGAHPNPVPVENTGGSGTRDSHWRETLLTTELMTGWISSGGNPLSRLTVGSLQDMGYGVNFGAADSFSGASEPIFGQPITFMRLVEQAPPTPVVVVPPNP